MDGNFEKAKEITEKYGQEHLLKNFEKLPEINKHILIKQILDINFDQVNKLFKNMSNIGKETNDIVEPIKFIDKEKLSFEDKKKYNEIGEKAIREGKLAVVTMAGGQGTRLGFDGPKGTFDLGLDSHKTLFEILCDTLKEAKKRYDITIPWYIMTSEENNEDTKEFFDQNNYFDYPKEMIQFFKQGKFPMMDTKGKLLKDENGLIKEAADGHRWSIYCNVKEWNYEGYEGKRNRVDFYRWSR